MAVTDMDTISLAVWDVPMPVIAGETFTIKIGAKSAAGRALAGSRVEVSANGAIAASGKLGNTPWPETEALYWTEIELPASREMGVAQFTVQAEGAVSQFSVAVAAKPEHKLSVVITERDSKAALDGVEIRLGPFHARTDKSGRAELRICKGEYRLELWRTAHIAPPQPMTINSDTQLELTMVHVPEDHPDARWVR